MPIDAEWTEHLENILLEFRKNENKRVDLNTINGCFDAMVCAVVEKVGSTLRDLYVGEDVSYSNFLCDEGMSPEIGVLTDVSIVEVARMCPNLEVLDVSACELLTDVSIVEVARMCPKLMQLNLHGCSNLTDVSIVEVARWCSKLKWLDVSGCSKLTNVSVVEVASKCSNVEYIGARSR